GRRRRSDARSWRRDAPGRRGDPDLGRDGQGQLPGRAMNEKRSRSAPEGAGLTRAGRAQLPLLDRLVDAAPAEQTDRPLSAAAAMDVLRASICSDLEELLNTRRRGRSWA